MIKKLYNDGNNPKDLAEICSVLNDGGIVVLPTDTLYAVCCHALKERAIERICSLKQIDLKRKSLSVCFADLSHISDYCMVENNVFKVMKRNLPGPFTFILKASSKLPKIFKNRKEVGIRIPDNEIFREILNELGAPILTTTVPYDEDDDVEYLTDPELIEEKWGSYVDIVIDGGYGQTEPSTIIDCTEGDFEIIRQGKGELE